MNSLSKFIPMSLVVLSSMTCTHLWAATQTQCTSIPSIIDDGNADGSIAHPYILASDQEVDINSIKAGTDVYLAFNKDTKGMPAFLAGLMKNSDENVTITERKDCPPTQSDFDFNGITVFKSKDVGRILVSYVEDTQADANYWFKIHANTDVSMIGFEPILQGDDSTLQDILNFQ
ncbi:hypothetical protein [Parashewanella tropica]|uniref:hypothetical protein n=1 Tax=Parashewanella tropica TaxID=2547970 RepID=UPI00105A5464|nr:hypothetical protein [Parashewanella tropica]